MLKEKCGKLKFAFCILLYSASGRNTVASTVKRAEIKVMECFRCFGKNLKHSMKNDQNDQAATPVTCRIEAMS